MSEKKCGDLGMHWWTKESNTTGHCQCGLIPERLFFVTVKCECGATYRRRGPRMKEQEWIDQHSDSCPYKAWRIERRDLLASSPLEASHDARTSLGGE